MPRSTLAGEPKESEVAVSSTQDEDADGDLKEGRESDSPRRRFQPRVRPKHNQRSLVLGLVDEVYTTYISPDDNRIPSCCIY